MKSQPLKFIFTFCFAACLYPPCGFPDSPEPTELNNESWAADHHMHLGSEDICLRLGDCLISNQPPAVYASDAIRALDAAHVQKGVVFSSAYLYGLTSLGLSAEEVELRIRRENQFTATEISKYPDRLVGFFSLDALQPSAMDEFRHWQDSDVLVGLKLHFTVSAIDIHNETHRTRLIEVIEAAATQNLPIVMHIGGGDFGAENAEIFIQTILPHAKSTWVQIAHAGGGLPLVDDHHVQALRTFADHIERGDVNTQKVLFDISYVPAPEEDQATIDALLLEMRRIGMHRFLFASDYNVLMPGEQMMALQRLGLSKQEQQTLRRNCAPWVACKPQQSEADQH